MVRCAGGDSLFYAYGSYTSGNGNWKGEVTNQEHSPAFGERAVWERKVVAIGFTGSYTDETAEADGIALAGKQSIRFKSKLRLLIVSTETIGCKPDYGPEREC